MQRIEPVFRPPQRHPAPAAPAGPAPAAPPADPVPTDPVPTDPVPTDPVPTDRPQAGAPAARRPELPRSDRPAESAPPRPTAPTAPTRPLVPVRPAPRPRPVDYDAVKVLARQVSDELTGWLHEHGRAGDEDRGRERDRLAADAVAGYADARRGTGTPLSRVDEQRILAALHADLSGLGRLQTLLGDPSIEEIHLLGCDRVRITRRDGSIEAGEPIAGSDDEMIEILQTAARRAGATERSLSTAKPTLDLQLPEGSRLAAVYRVSHRPYAVIRRHNTLDVTLDALAGGRADLAEMIDPLMREFLRAATRAGLNVMVAGLVGAGKTTLLRALAAEIPASDPLVVLEESRELGLHSSGRHPWAMSFEAREGHGERGADGRPAGEVSIADLIPLALRMGAQRIIVGEVRSREIVPMLQAMTTSRGSMCTIHARTPAAVTDRIIELALTHGRDMTVELARRMAGNALDLIVYVTVEDETAHRRPQAPVRVPHRGSRRGRGRPDRHHHRVRARPGRPRRPPALAAAGPRPAPSGRLRPASALAVDRERPRRLAARTPQRPGSGTDMNIELLAVLGGATAAAGVLLAVATAVGVSALRRASPARPPRRWGVLAWWRGDGLDFRQRRTRRAQAAGTVMAGALAWLITGMPVVGLLTAAAVVGGPWLFTVGRAETRAITRIEAVGEWARRLRDIAERGVGLQQAMVTSAANAPADIDHEVGTLAARLQAGWNADAALRAFADDVADPVADQVVAALILHLADRGEHLGDVLSSIAAAAAAEVATRREVHAKRTQPYFAVRFLTGMTLAALGYGLVRAEYMRPYANPTGQLVMAGFGAAFIGLLVWVRAISQPPRIPRLLAASTDEVAR